MGGAALACRAVTATSGSRAIRATPTKEGSPRRAAAVRSSQSSSSEGLAPAPRFRQLCE